MTINKWKQTCLTSPKYDIWWSIRPGQHWNWKGERRHREHGISSKAVRRRTGGRRRRWVVLWPAAAARRKFFIGGGGVALWSAAAASDRMRGHWNSALAGQAFFFWFYRCQPLPLWSPLGRWRRTVNCEYACFAQFHSRKELIVHCLISGGSHKCNV